MEKYRPQPDRKHNAPEGGLGSHGFHNRQPEQVAHGGGGSNTPERQPLPNVCEVLERMVRLDAPDVDGRPRWGTQEYKSEADEVNRLTTEIRKEGTTRDQLIFDLYSNITRELAPFPNPVDFRDLSLAEYRQFRLKVEKLSDQELAEEIRKAKEEFERKSDEFFRREGGDPPSTDSIVNT